VGKSEPGIFFFFFYESGLGCFVLLVNGSVKVGLGIMWVGSKLRLGS
jgi:hypothetical protein